MIQQLSRLLSNQYIHELLMVILIMYCSVAHQKLPNFMYNLFDNRLFIFVIFVAITIVGLQNWSVALIVALIFAIIMNQVNQAKIEQEIEPFMS